MTLKKIIIRVYLAVALMMILLVFGVYYIAHYQMIGQRQQSLHTAITAIAESVSKETQALTHWVDAVATDEAIINSFQAEESIRNLKARELEVKTYGLLRLRLLLPGVNQPDESQVPHLGYADLELVQTAQSENPLPVIVQIKLPHAHIAIARAVYQNEKIVGTVLASFSTERIKQHILTLSTQDGTFALFQDDSSLTNTGDVTLMENEPSGTLPVTGTPWEIRYWKLMAIDYGELVYAGIALLSALLLLGLLCVLTLRKLDSMFESDITELKKCASNVFQGIKANDYELKFPMFSELIKHIRLLNITEVSEGNAAIEVELTTHEEEERKLAERGDELIRDLDKQFAQADAMMNDLESDEFDLNQKSGADVGDSAEMEVSSSSAVDIPVSVPLTTGVTGVINKDFNNDYLRGLGCAIGTELLEAGMTKIVVGIGHSDTSNKALKGVSVGLLAAGSRILDLKRVASPVVAFATQFPKESMGIVASDSFLPVKTCQLKVLFNGSFVSAEFLETVTQRIKSGSFLEGLGVSGSSDTNSEADYIGAIVEDIHIHCNMKVAIYSASKSVTGLAADLLKALGCDVVTIPETMHHNENGELFDPRNPSHLKPLSAVVTSEQVDLGIAYNSDGTGFAIIDSSGHIIWPDRVMMVLTADVLQTFPGADILFDSDSLSALSKTVTRYSGKLITHGSGEDVFRQLAPTNMPLAGNMNGQFVFADRWLNYPDAIYASARLLEVLSASDESSQDVFSELPDYEGTQPFFSKVSESAAHKLLEKWSQKFTDSGSTVISIDNGLRVEVSKIGWLIIRYQKHQGGLMFRFQADTVDGLQTLMKSIKKLVPRNSSITLPF